MVAAASRPRSGRRASRPRRTGPRPARTTGGTRRRRARGRPARRGSGRRRRSRRRPAASDPVAVEPAGRRIAHARGGAPGAGVEHVRGDGRAVVRAPYPPPMSELSIRVGDLHFSARWEPEAPQTIEVIRAMLPAARAADPLPLERRVDVDPVRRPAAGRGLGAPHVAPGARPPRALPGRHQRVRDLLPVRRRARRRRRSASWRRTTSRRSCPTRAGRTGCARSGGGACGRAPRRSRSPRPRSLTRGGPRRPRRHRRHGRRLAGRRRRGRGRPDRGDRAGPVRAGGDGARGRRRDRAARAARRRRRPHPHARRLATRSRTGSSRTRWRRRSAARRRSSRSTTRGRARRRRPRGRSRSGLREWQAATSADSAVDVGLSLVVTADQPDAARGDAGRHRGRRADAQGVHGLRLRGRRRDAAPGAGARPASAAGCSRSTARTGRSSRR